MHWKQKKYVTHFIAKFTLLQNLLYCGGLELSLHYLWGLPVHLLVYGNGQRWMDKFDNFPVGFWSFLYYREFTWHLQIAACILTYNSWALLP